MHECEDLRVPPSVEPGETNSKFTATLTICPILVHFQASNSLLSEVSGGNTFSAPICYNSKIIHLFVPNLSLITFAKSHLSFLSDLDDLVFRTRQKSCGEQFFFEEPMF